MEKNSKYFVNPFQYKIRDYPGRIYCFDHFLDTVSALQADMIGFDRVFVEIGSGSGVHLIEQAKRLSECLFIGMELRFKRAVRTMQKFEKICVEFDCTRSEIARRNLSILHCDASEIMRIFLPNSLDGIYVNFPDPWDKPKQRKHRLFSKSFLNSLSELLKRGAFVSFKTDHDDYFNYVLNLFYSDSRFCFESLSWNFYKDTLCNTNKGSVEQGEINKKAEQPIMSEFEKMFIKQGLPIKYLCVRLREAHIA